MANRPHLNLTPQPPTERCFSRRDVLRLMGASLLGGALAGCASTELSPDMPVKIGYIPITDATPLLIAHHNGYFAAEGLVSEPPTLIRGWSQLSEAFMARTFNLVHLLMPVTIFMRYSLKYPVTVIAWDHLNNSAITVHKDSGINSLEELGGRQIAVPYWYSIHNILIQLVARTYGLQPVIQDIKIPLQPNQVNLVVMTPPDMPTALGTGAIDGYIVAEPFNAAGEMLAGGKILRFTGDIWKNHPCCVAVLHQDVIQQNQSWAQKVTNAVVKAEYWSQENMDEVAHILSTDGAGYLPFPEDIIKRSMLNYDMQMYGPNGTGAIKHPEWGLNRIGFQPFQFRSDTRRMVELLKETVIKGEDHFLGNLSPDLVVEDLMDYRMVTAAAEALGGLKLFDGVDPNQPYQRDVIIDV